LGREIAAELGGMGATTVLVARDARRVGAAAQEISKAVGSSRIETLPVTDLALRSEMVRVADELLARYSRIDVLVNNAGGMFSPRDETSDGLERTFALNVLAPFVLTDRLSVRMRQSAPARVVQIASAAHRSGRVRFDDLQSRHRYFGWRAYAASKLELILLTREFARRFTGTGISVNAVHPGFVRTHFGQNNGRGSAAAIRFFAWVGGRSVLRGAQTPVFVATDPSVAAISGEYFSDRKIARASPASYDMECARRLYDECAALATPQ
jgi:NAD(P)-dependent dehydrogenase (short-subunit alcohol dehydrogenase family)